jgi:hypothetical protein
MRFTDHNDGDITVEWRLDYQDLEQVGYALQSAGIGLKGGIVDQGFYDDGTAMLEAAWEAQSREESDTPGLMIGVVDDRGH